MFQQIATSSGGKPLLYGGSKVLVVLQHPVYSLFNDLFGVFAGLRRNLMKTRFFLWREVHFHAIPV